MGKFQFQLADAGDDAALRRVLASTPMDGAIRIAFAREPSYFDAAEVDGQMVQVGVVRELASGRVIGMGSRAVSTCFVNGQEEHVGYLSGLRLQPQFRGHAVLLARGYAFLNQLHQDGQARYYLTTIAEDNEPALRLLTSERAGLPVYHSLGRYVTLVMGRVRPVAAPDSVDVRLAGAEDRDAILSFLREHGSRRQFFPAYCRDDLFSQSGRLRQLAPHDTLLAFQHGDLVGTLGCWNQASFKQTIVAGYRPSLRFARPLYNCWAWLRRAPQMPAAGERLRVAYGAIPVVRDDNSHIFRRLLTAAVRQHGRDAGAFLLGFFESDPLLPLARRFAIRQYVTRLFLVYWRDERPDVAALMNRTPYLELGCL